jgi:hypothetical protein
MPDLRRQQGGIPTFFGEPVAVGGGALAAGEGALAANHHSFYFNLTINI